MIYLFRRLIICTMFALTLGACTGYVLRQVSYPTLDNTFEKSEKVHKRKDLDWIIKVEDIEFSVDVKNYRIVESESSIAFIPTSKIGVRAPNVDKYPFVIDIGARAKRADYVLDTHNAVLSMKSGNYIVKPSAIYVAHSGKELDCLLWRENDLNLPLARSTIRIPTTSVPAKPDSPRHWKCIKYVFNIPTPDPETRFSLLLGQINTQDSEQSDEILINFSPLYYESRSTH